MFKKTMKIFLNNKIKFKIILKILKIYVNQKNQIQYK